MIRVLLLAAITALCAVGCATPRWIYVSDDHPQEAINDKHLGRALVAAVQAARDEDVGPAPYALVLPRGASPETYAQVVHQLGEDARVPAGIPAVEVDADTGRAVLRDEAVRAAEAASLPVATPSGTLPVYHLRALRLSGQRGEVDIVCPLNSGLRVVTVSMVLDTGHGWRATGVRLWRGLDPASGL